MSGVLAKDNRGSDNGLVVIPALNEAENIGSVVTAILATCNYPVVVVDDCSEDDTASAARAAGAEVISLCTRLGAWGAMQTGMRYALDQDFDFLITMDGDGQHPAEDLPRLLAPLRAMQADIVVGNCISRGSQARRLAWKMMRAVSGLGIGDLTSGMRAYNRGAVELLCNDEAGLLEYQDLGVLLLARRSGLEITEVAVSMRERSNGRSRVFASWGIVGYYMACTLLLGLSKHQRRLVTRLRAGDNTE